jgi:hypothetical protein
MKTIKRRDIRTKAHNRGVVALLFFCFNALLNKIADMEKRGVSEEIYQGELKGKTKDHKEVKVKYGYGIKVGLNEKF